MMGLESEKQVGTTFNLESIRTRLLIIMLTLMFLSLSMLTGLSYYFTNKALLKSVNETAAAIGTDYSRRVSSFVMELVLFVEDVAANPHLVDGSDRQQIVAALSEGLRRNTNFTGINYGDLEGNMIRAQGDTAYLGDRAYYQQAVQTKKMTISEPLISKGSGRISLAIAVPILVNGEVKAIIQATMPLDSLNDIVKGIHFMDSGYGFIVDQSGMLIAHAKRPELNGRIKLSEKAVNPELANGISEMDANLIALFEKTVAGDQQVQGSYMASQGSIFTVFTPVTLPAGARWIVAVSAPDSEVLHAIKQLNVILIAVAAACLLGGMLVIFLISTRFARPEERYFKAFRQVADVIGIINIRNGQFIEVNNAFYKLLGYNREKVIGHTPDEVGLWVRDAEQTAYAPLRTGQEIYNAEVLWYTEDGKVRTGLFSADIITIGLERYAVFIWHDITEKKKAEAALKQAYGELENKVEERTQELSAANQELVAINEEMSAMNEELLKTNQCLYEENYIRRQTEDKLLLRERQYRATTSLLTGSVGGVEDFTEAVLHNAIDLVKATCGFIGIYQKEGTLFVIHRDIGMQEHLALQQIAVENGPLQEVYQTGKAIYTKDCSWCMVLPEEEEKPVEVNMILVPFSQEHQVKGILAAVWLGEVCGDNQEDAEVLQQFANLAIFTIERAHAQKKIRHMAFYDVLTGLPNRLSLGLSLEEELQRARQGIAEGLLLFVDIDDLKSVNDTFGHSAGDKVIIQAGECLKKAFPGHDMVFRISGDEFIVIIPGKATLANAAQNANLALQHLCQEYDLTEAQVQMSASIGVVFYPEHGNRPEEVLKKADIAMYAAKESGKNCWHLFEQGLLQKTAEDMTLINGLRRALVKNEFFLAYQPQLTTDGQRIVGVEALLRWHSPEYGLVSPARFIPLAERSSLIVQIGQWVFQETCRFVKQLNDRGLPDIRVAVNISPRQMKNENFVSVIRDTIKAHGIAPMQIELEVTENVFIDHLEDSIEKLKQLQAYGIHLALDDFGTGFSSLTYLRNLPVNSLKIDKSFIDAIASDEMQLQFVNSIISLGHTLGMSIVAEGVETKDQLDKLVNCDYVQGYFFSKPVSAQEFVSWLTAR